MMKGKKGIELSVNFLVTLILSIVVFGMGIYLSTIIFGGGGSIADKKFEDFDKEVGELSCYAADNVCVHVKTETIYRGKDKTLAVTIKNALNGKKQFRLVVQNTKYVDQANVEKTAEKLSLFGLDKPEGRVQELEKGEKNTFGIPVEVPKTAPSGTYTLDVMVYYAEPGAAADAWTNYIDRPFKIFITVP